MMMGTKVYSKQCMYSLKQSHGTVEKKCCLHVFSKKWEREKEKSDSVLEVYKHEEWDIILVSVTQACSVLLWCYVTMKIAIVAKSVGCLEGFRMLERTPAREVTSDGVLFPQSDSPICRVVWYKNNTENRSII